MADFALRGVLSLDSKQFQTSTKQAATETSKFSKSASKDFALMSQAGKVAFAGLVAASAVWLKNAVGLAVTAEETVSKFNTVTGASASFADSLLDQATLFGTTRSEMQGLVGDLAAVAQGFGFTEAESVKLAVSSVELAGDLASFNNIAGGSAEVSQILTAAYAGEREQLKRLGIVITQADVDAQALADTNKDSAKQLTAAEKAAATYTLVVDRAGKAVGDLNRTSDSTANQQRAVAAAFREVQEEAGQKLIPVLNRFLEIGTAALPAFASVMVEIAELITGFVDGIAALAGQLDVLPAGFAKVVAAAGGLTAALLAISANPVVAGLAIVAGAVALIGQNAAVNQPAVDTLAASVQELEGALTEAAVTDFLSADDLAEFAEAGITIEDITEAVTEGGDAFLELGGKIEDANRWAVEGALVTPRLKTRLIELRSAVLQADDAIQDQAQAQAVANGEMYDADLASAVAAAGNYEVATSAEAAAAAQAILSAALTEYVDQQRALVDPVFAQIKATQDLAAAQAELSATELEFGAGSDEAGAATIAVIEAQLDLEDAYARVVESGESSLNTVRDVGNRAELSGTQMQGLTEDVRDAEEAATDFAGDYEAEFDADTSPADRALAEWQASAAEEVTATVQATIAVTAFTAGGGSLIRGFAAGTDNAPPGFAIVGEDGPELVQFDGGERVIPSSDTMAFLAGGGQTINAEFTISGAQSPQATSREVVRSLTKLQTKYTAGQRRPA